MSPSVSERLLGAHKTGCSGADCRLMGRAGGRSGDGQEAGHQERIQIEDRWAYGCNRTG